MGEKIKNPQDIQLRHKRIKVAIICIVAIAIFYIGANFLKGINIFNSTTYYYCVMDNVNGIQQSSSVQLAGYKIGIVQSTELISTQPPRICAKIMLTEKIDIPDDSELKITSSGLLSSTVLSLIMGSSSSNFHDGDTIKCSKEPDLLSGIEDMKGQVASILSSVDTIGLELKDILHKDGGGESLRTTLTNIQMTTEHLNYIVAHNEEKIGNLVSNIEHFSKTLNEATPQLKNILQNFDQISDTLAKAEIASVITHADKTIQEVEEIVEKVNRGEGTIGNIINEDGIAKKIDKTIESLNLLIEDLKANPKRYVHFSLFGQKDKKQKK